MAEKDIATRLKDAILQFGTYEKVAELTDISVSSLKRFSSGKTSPKIEDVIKICAITNTSLQEIAFGDTDGFLTPYQLEIVKKMTNLTKEQQAILSQLIDQLRK
ncbi:helix-turn-helix domain-containing protein (plasmid) [Vibrio alginolyticus]|nr:helix-turn-helix domain-containing protein [Vibrio alginolyticus]